MPNFAYTYLLSFFQDNWGNVMNIIDQSNSKTQHEVGLAALWPIIMMRFHYVQRHTLVGLYLNLLLKYLVDSQHNSISCSVSATNWPFVLLEHDYKIVMQGGNFARSELLVSEAANVACSRKHSWITPWISIAIIFTCNETLERHNGHGMFPMYVLCRAHGVCERSELLEVSSTPPPLTYVGTLVDKGGWSYKLQIYVYFLTIPFKC